MNDTDVATWLTARMAATVTDAPDRHLIGVDDMPLVTAHGTEMTDTDRQLAAGHSGLVQPPTIQVKNTLLRNHVLRSWRGTTEAAEPLHDRQASWATTAGVPVDVAGQLWHQISGLDQSRLIATWLDQHRSHSPRLVAGKPLPDPPFHPQPVKANTADAAAAAMFNHRPAPAVPSPVSPAMFPPASRARNSLPSPASVAAARIEQPLRRQPGHDHGR